MKIEWDELKFRILSRFLKDYPFLGARSISAINMERYVKSHKLIEENSESIEDVLLNAYQTIFKSIGMKVDIRSYFGNNLNSIKEIESLSFTPIITFNLNKGLDFGVYKNELYNLDRNQLVEYIMKMRLLVSEKENLIDLVFGDIAYLKECISKLRKNEKVLTHILTLSNEIKSKELLKKSIEMKLRYTSIIKKEIKKYIEEKNIQKEKCQTS